MAQNISVSVSCSVVDLANIGIFFENKGVALATSRSGLVRQAVQFLAEVAKNSNKGHCESSEDALTFFNARDLNGQKWKGLTKETQKVIERSETQKPQTDAEVSALIETIKETL